MNIADQAGNLTLLRAPWQNGKSIQIRPQILIAFIDAHKACDTASIDHDLVIHSLFNLARSNGYVLQLTENIGKLHPDKFHIIFPHHADDIFLAVLAHEKASFTK